MFYSIFLFIQKIFCKEDSIKYESNEKILDLSSSTDIELPSKDDENIFYIPIFHTNDIHGSFYQKNILLPSGKSYSIGGLDYLGKYASIMSEYWKERFLYFDTGDQFQGGIEGFISKGKIIP